MNTKLLIVILLVVSAILPSFAQKKVEVELTQKKMSEGNQTAFTVLIPEANEIELVQKEWKSFVNKESIIAHMSNAVSVDFLEISAKSKKEKKALAKQTGKLESRGGELVVKNFLLDEMSGGHVDIISLLEKADNGVFIYSFFKYGEDQFVAKSSVKKEIEKILRSYMRAFGVKAYQEVVEEQVDVEENKLKEQEKILSDLEKDNKNLNKSIEKNEEGISELNTQLNTLNAESKLQAEGLAEIAESLVGMTETSFDYDLTKKKEKEKLKEKKKGDKQIDSCKSKIKKNEKAISDAKTGIEENIEAQANQKQVVADQEKIVEQFETKLSNIK